MSSAVLEQLVKRLGVFAALALLTVIALISYRSVQDFERQAALVEQAHRVKSEIASLESAYSRARFLWRSYLISGEPGTLLEYEAAAREIPQQVARLMQLAAAGVRQPVARIQAMLEADLRALDAQAAARRAGDLDQPRQVLQAIADARPGVGDLAAQIESLLAGENAVLEARKRETERSAGLTKGVIVAGNIAAFTLLLLAYLLLGREIRERRAAEAAARRLASELDDLYNNAPCGYHSVDANGLIVRMNDTWLKWLGYSRDEVVGRLHHPELMSAQSAKRFREEAFPLFRKQGWLKEVEFEYVRKDGTTFPGSLQTSTIYDAHGRYVMSRTTVFDITERRRMEAALRESNAFLDSIVENIPDMIFVKDADELRFVRFNRAGEELLGHARADLIGRNDHDFFPGEQADFFAAKDRQVLAGGRVVDIPEEQIATRERGVRILHTKKIPVPDENGRPRYLLGISEDITERKAAEERIHTLNDALQTHAAQLEAANKELESFSYSVSHDLRAPLRAVDGFARMLEEDYGARLDPEGRRLLAVVRDNAAQMARLIDDLLAFSRLGRQAPAKSLVDMTGLAREVAQELAAAGGAQIEIGELPAAAADRSLLRQVWANLIGNALKYSAKSAAPRVEIGGRVNAGDHEYWVRDNGVGFDMRYAGKLFGVFQRLHRSEEFPGTGVGLAIVQRVISRHGGRVRAEARLNEGACFWFTLPKEEVG